MDKLRASHYARLHRVIEMVHEQNPEKSGSYLSNMLQELCVEIGIRDAGSEGDARAAHLILRELSTLCSHAEEQPFEFNRWVLAAPARLTVGDREVACCPYYGSRGTTPGRLGGFLRRPLASDELPSDFDGYVLADGTKRAVALLAPGPFGPAVPSYQPELTDRGIPVCGVDRADDSRFMGAVEGKTGVLLQLSTEIEQHARTSNVVGTIPGATPDEILFIAHRDTQYTSPGANDNAASLVVMLMLAAYFQHRRQAFTLTFLASGAEEIGFLGAFEYARRRAEEGSLGRVRFCLNFDSLTYGPHPQIRTSDNQLAEELAARFRDSDPGSRPNLIPEVDVLDGAPFVRAGIPTVHLNSRGDDESKLRLWHRAEDLPATVDPSLVDHSVRAIANFVERQSEPGQRRGG